MTNFDEEPEHQPTKEEYEAYESEQDQAMLKRMWEINPKIMTLQMSKMVFDSDVIMIARAAIESTINKG